MSRAGAGREGAPAPPPPVFLERQSYRRRRLADAARLLPILGGALFAVPLLWPRGDAAGGAAGGGGAAGIAPGIAPVATSSAILYIFAVWAGLIALTALYGRLAGEVPAGDGIGETAGNGPGAAVAAGESVGEIVGESAGESAAGALAGGRRGGGAEGG